VNSLDKTQLFFIPQAISKPMARSLAFFKAHKQFKTQVVKSSPADPGKQAFVATLKQSKYGMHEFQLTFTFTTVAEGTSVIVEIAPKEQGTWVSVTAGASMFLIEWADSLGFDCSALKAEEQKMMEMARAILGNNRGKSVQAQVEAIRSGLGVNVQTEQSFDTDHLPHDDLFKDQAHLSKAVGEYTTGDWEQVKRDIDAYFNTALTRFMQGAERVDRGTNVDLMAINPRIRPRSDASFKVAAFARFEREGYQHPENLPAYYEDEARKMEEKTRQLLAVMPRMACPGCGSELYTFEEDKTKPMGRDLVTGKTAYGSVFTCKACGRKYSQAEGQGRK
jgi:uncharacterized protein YbaR (Trm112 family)